jgi:hypothetical protein
MCVNCVLYSNCRRPEKEAGRGCSGLGDYVIDARDDITRLTDRVAALEKRLDTLALKRRIPLDNVCPFCYSKKDKDDAKDR